MGIIRSSSNEGDAQPVMPRETAHTGMAARAFEMVLRVLALLLCLAGALVLAKIKQDAVVTLAGISVRVPARHSYVKAYVFLVYANGIVAIYSLIALLLGFISRRRLIAGLLFVMDLLMSYLLLAAAAASVEASYIAKRGELKVGWGAVCSNIEHFCAVVGVSIALSLVATIVLIFLTILSGRRFFVGRSPPLSGSQA